jgi:hypothetical protein
MVAAGESEMDTRHFYEAEDLALYVTPELISPRRVVTRGKLGVA